MEDGSAEGGKADARGDAAWVSHEQHLRRDSKNPGEYWPGKGSSIKLHKNLVFPEEGGWEAVQDLAEML